MPRVSVLIPTHGRRAATLPFAVASVQAQGIDDIEILIVGDGVDDEVRSTVERLRANDSRIRFFDFPKGPRNGEIHRDGVLRQARGRIICYQADDDLWLPGHLQDMQAALEDADFVGAMHVNVELEGRVRAYFFDIERPEFRDLWVKWQAHPYGPWASNGFGLAFAGHRLEAYLRLPEGWTTTPTGLATDQFMWTKFAREPWCRIRALQWPVSLHFPAPDRRKWTDQQRVDELARWTEIIGRPDGREHVYRAMLRTFGDILLGQSSATVQQRAALSAALEREETLRARAQVERDAAQTLRAKAQAERGAERTLRAKAEAERSTEQTLRANAEAERNTEQTLRANAEAERNTEQTLRANAEAERDAEHTLRAHAQAERNAEQVLRAHAQAERDAIRQSAFWRLTAPLRATINLFKRR
jgi:GalNAc5-diNAcBac-PP-undecaprenol beta-1,3-glucosyltransferase